MDGKELSYDQAGRLAKCIDGTGTESGSSWECEWDSMGRLRRAARPDGKSWTCSYDALGRRISKSGPEGSTYCLWNRHAIIQSLPQGDVPSSWIDSASGIIPLAQESQGKMYSVIPDHLGTPTELLDESGNIAWSATYNLFGELKQEDKKGPGCEIRFPGQWHDDETGLHYNRFRYYDPYTGSYLSRDPIGYLGGLNPYSYCGDSLNWIDPFGLGILYRGMKKGADGGPIVYSGEPTGGGANNASNSLGVAAKDEG